MSNILSTGCVIARAELYIQSETVFLPESVFTQHIFARDYFTTMNLVENVKKNGSKLIHQTLLIHQ